MFISDGGGWADIIIILAFEIPPSVHLYWINFNTKPTNLKFLHCGDCFGEVAVEKTPVLVWREKRFKFY